MFASWESTRHSRARPDQPPSFVSPAVVDWTAVEAVSDLSESSLVLCGTRPRFVRGDRQMAAPQSVGVRS
jgi:hypothetical protein